MDNNNTFIHLQVDGHLGSFHFWAIINTAAMKMLYQFLCGRTLSFLSGINLGTRLLD